jgi:hypothetical protein
MTRSSEAFMRDANNVPITDLGLNASKAITYVGATTGATGATTLFTVTGAVSVRVFGICGTTIVGAGTLEVGISGDTARILAQIADATDLATDEIYLDATPTLEVEALPSELIISNGQDIIQTIGITALTAGQITYYCLWTPISSDGNVVVA